jgi:hypothetical protein
VNKKVLLMVVVVFGVVVLATPFVGAVQACRPRRCRTVETFTLTPDSTTPSTLTDMEQLVPATLKFVCDGTIRISRGGIRRFSYDGALGTGTLYTENIVSITRVSGMMQLAGKDENVTGHGSGIYKWTLEIENGPYGTGTLMGISRTKIDWNFAELRLENWDTATLRPITGDLDIIKVYVKGYNLFSIPLIGYWWTTTTIVS